MSKVNEMGSQLIEYKKELNKNHPRLIKDSLLLSLEQMTESGLISLDVFNLIKDKSIDIESFTEYLSSKSEFNKTTEEVLKELEQLKAEIDLKLQELDAQDLATECIVEKESIVISKPFSIDEGFVLKYFGVEDKDLPKLMRRRGFVEKFSVLRLTVIMRHILSQISPNEEYFNTDMSLVYFSKEKSVYSIDMLFEINSKKIKDEDFLNSAIDKIMEIKEQGEFIYIEKMIS